MKIFLSWSGERSHAIASIFNEWLPEVLTSVSPWISSQHISKGASWLNEIRDAIGLSSGMGVFFLTPEALSSPWMLFEAGGVAALGEKKVCTVLVQLETEGVTSPWNTFQGTKLTKADLLQLVKDINARTDTPLTDQRVGRIFERAWPDLQVQLETALRAGVADVVLPNAPVVADDESGDVTSRIEAMSQGMQGVEARLGRLEEETQKANTRIMENLVYIGRQVNRLGAPPPPPAPPPAPGRAPFATMSDVIAANALGNVGRHTLVPTNALFHGGYDAVLAANPLAPASVQMTNALASKSESQPSSEKKVKKD